MSAGVSMPVTLVIWLVERLSSVSCFNLSTP